MKNHVSHRVRLSLLLWSGLFRTDAGEPLLLRIWELLSRFTWQLLQTMTGLLWAQGAIAAGKVSEVKFFGGATVVCGSGTPRGSASLGLYLQMRPPARGREVAVGLGGGSYLFMHEFGHYRQSRIWGPLYLPVIGLPSFLGAHWTEVDANRRSARFLRERFGFEWDACYFPEDSPRRLYCRLV